MTPLEGVLIVDKPSGPTSHDVVERVRRFCRGLRVGHTGTLDPFATGVLPLCIGRATRLARFLTSTRKSYEGVIRLGVVTDSYDRDGRILYKKPVAADRRDIEREAARFVGTIQQTPPAYSARRIQGERLYKLARQGRSATAPPATVTVHAFEILDVTGASIRFRAETSAGTYVRSLAHELGERLECGGHLAELRRTAAGRFRIEDSYTMAAIEDCGRGRTLGDLVIPVRAIDLGMPSVGVTAGGLAAMRTGRPIPSGEFVEITNQSASGDLEGHVCVRDEAGEMLGLAVADRGDDGATILRPEVVLPA